MFKVSGREMTEGDFVRTVAAYQDRQYNGNLVKLLTCFISSDYLSLFHIDGQAVREVLPKILSRRSGCHELLCRKCGICHEWTSLHPIVRGDIVEIRERLKKRAYNA